MSEQQQRELDVIESVAGQGTLKKGMAYAKLSGPGWLQGAITLGGGSLAGALYLGVISGYHLMWLQPLAMVCGIIMLSAISYVTLTTGQRPFGLINAHLSPWLGWSWVVATIMANIVWCMPQFNLGRAAVQQNLLPVVGDSTFSTVVICLILLALAFTVNVFYESDARGIKTFERILKAMVAAIVISFVLVVGTLSMSGAIPWGQVLGGFIPRITNLFEPAPAYLDLIAASANPEFWMHRIQGDQQDIIIAAFGTAVGINMTFLLPYTLLRRGWGGRHRGLAIFDLSIGLFVPFFVATACVVIASATSFHAQTADVLDADGRPVPALAGAMNKLVVACEASLPEGVTLAESDRQLAAMLVKRDNFQLASTLEPLAGKAVAQTVFGLGVLGMALSTIIILMLMNGIAFTEAFGTPGNKAVHFLGCTVSGLAGVAGPFIWGNSEAKAALAIPTSVIGGSLIPIAYFTFLLLMNSKAVLGDRRPTGGTRIAWNVLMGAATAIATFGSLWVLHGKSASPGFAGGAAKAGIAFAVILFGVGLTAFVTKERNTHT